MSGSGRWRPCCRTAWLLLGRMQGILEYELEGRPLARLLRHRAVRTVDVDDFRAAGRGKRERHWVRYIRRVRARQTRAATAATAARRAYALVPQSRSRRWVDRGRQEPSGWLVWRAPTGSRASRGTRAHGRRGVGCCRYRHNRSAGCHRCSGGRGRSHRGCGGRGRRWGENSVGGSSHRLRVH